MASDQVETCRISIIDNKVTTDHSCNGVEYKKYFYTKPCKKKAFLKHWVCMTKTNA